ncbi:hexosaminidase D-like isoform X2 [Cimex lectularius]|nr:hexosaminidase D-like isoform X2 [Cimex lectularius]
MFPYTSLDVSAKNAYSKNDIADILTMANKSSLEIIPLIQTFGHLEFVLKLEKYMHLREVNKYPQAICPSKEQSLEVLKNMIDDVMLMHKGYIEYLHIGCDEVYQIGECNDCKVRNYNNKWNNEDLFLAHVTTLATYIRTVYPGVTPLIWDDQMRSISLTQLSSWKIGDLVEPVIWKYTTDVEAYLTGDLWDKYKIIFPNVWFGSAFKGAKFPDTMISPVEYYFDIHRSWKSVIAMYSNDVNFKGGILTGWQRFDHFSILCELLPVAIPSLAINIMYLSSNIKTLSELSVHVQKITGCSVFIYGDKRCSFPGNSLHEEIAKFSQLIYRIKLAKNHSIFKGWMTSYNLDNAFSNPSHVEEISKEILSLYMELMELETSIEMAMDEVYNNATTKEWINVYLEPYKNELKMIVDGRNKILATDHWPKRPIG